MANDGRAARWAGRIVSAIPVLMLLMSAGFKLAGVVTRSPQMAQSWTSSGYPLATMLPIGIAEAACALVYAVPRTAVLGAVLMTGYLGGAVATHVRMSQGMWVVPALLGVFAWLGLFLRDARVRALLPVRASATR